MVLGQVTLAAELLEYALDSLSECLEHVDLRRESARISTAANGRNVWPDEAFPA
jgi:hypothetical protein